MNTEWNTDICTKDDYDRIITDINDFWNSDHIDGLRREHNPVFFYEFGNTALIVREGKQVIGYLFGLFSQTESTGYVKFIGVRALYRKRGVGRALYEYFIELAGKHGCNRIKAITGQGNVASIAFHRSLGMRLLGEPNEEGVPVVKDYAGPGLDRVVFEREI